MKQAISFIAGVGTIICYFAAGAMHIWTAWLINDVWGTFWGVVAFFTPPISDLVFAGITISQNGILNPYIISWVTLLAVWGLCVYLSER